MMPVGTGSRFFFRANTLSCCVMETMLAQLQTGQEVKLHDDRAVGSFLGEGLASACAYAGTAIIAAGEETVRKDRKNAEDRNSTWTAIRAAGERPPSR